MLLAVVGYLLAVAGYLLAVAGFCQMLRTACTELHDSDGTKTAKRELSMTVSNSTPGDGRIKAPDQWLALLLYAWNHPTSDYGSDRTAITRILKWALGGVRGQTQVLSYQIRIRVRAFPARGGATCQTRMKEGDTRGVGWKLGCRSGVISKPQAEKQASTELQGWGVIKRGKEAKLIKAKCTFLMGTWAWLLRATTSSVYPHVSGHVLRPYRDSLDRCNFICRLR